MTQCPTNGNKSSLMVARAEKTDFGGASLCAPACGAQKRAGVFAETKPLCVSLILVPGGSLASFL